MKNPEEKTGEEKLSCSDEECPWCDSTGDVKRNNRIYWGAVLLIVVFFAVLYILAVKS